MNNVRLIDFLDTKPLYYKEIDHCRVHLAYKILKPHIKHPTTIHIVGTNGKGSTGRMIAHLAHLGDLKSCDTAKNRPTLSVGHFSSPHILRFNERIWIDGEDSTDEVLDEAHNKLYSILGAEVSDALSYFEYTTLLAFVVFEHCDLVVLEAGLGGEFDATNVCDKELSVITPIGIDHQAFLGEKIEQIASTKIRSIQKQMLLAPQVYDEVADVAKKICQEKEAILHKVQIKQSQIEALKEKADWERYPTYLLENAMVAMQALDILDISYDIANLKSLKLFGRFYPIAPNIHIDVGHNPLAAKAIANALKKPVVLIYNSLNDKDYEEVLRILKAKVKRVEIIAIDSQRATTPKTIENTLQRLGIEYSDYDSTISMDEKYLVFGSFYVVEKFLKTYKKLHR